MIVLIRTSWHEGDSEDLPIEIDFFCFGSNVHGGNQSAIEIAGVARAQRETGVWWQKKSRLG